MSFIRPEAAAGLIRWRDALIGLGALALGAYLVGTSLGLPYFLGWIALLGGGALTVTGIQRGRFRRAGGGVGIVEVDERQIAYFGPDFGGVIALEDLNRIASVPPHAWELTDTSLQRLTIPVDAEGTEALFDAFNALPGLNVTALTAAAQEPPDHRQVIWTRPTPRIG